MPDISRLPVKKKFFNFKFKDFKPSPKSKSLFSKAFIGFQLFLIVGLVGYIFSGTSSYLDVLIMKGKQRLESGNVAGISTVADATVPEKISIRITDRQEVLTTSEFDFKINKLVESTEKEPVTFIEKVNKVLKLDKPDVKVSYSVEFNEPKLEYWLKNRFGDLETSEKINSEIKYNNEEEKAIEKCKIGQGSAKLPIEQILTEIKNTYPPKDEMSFRLTGDPLSQDELQINSICESINKFEEKLVTIKINKFGTENEEEEEHEFIGLDSFKRIFEYKVVDDQFKVGIKDEKLLTDKFELLKTIVDVEPSKYDFRIKDDTLYILDKFEPGRFLNIEKTLEKFTKDIEEIDSFDSMSIIFDQIEQNEQIENMNIKRFPQIIGQGVVRSQLDPLSRTTTIKRLLNKMDAVLIKDGEEFSTLSLYGNPIEEDLYDEVSFENEEGLVTYYDNVQNVTTLLYRAVLESGLPITQRLEDLSVYYKEFYMYPYEEGTITTSVIFPPKPVKKTETKNTDEDVIEVEEINPVGAYDFKFVNNLGSDILIATSYKVGEDGKLYTFISLYSTESSTPYKVEISDFTSENFSSEVGDGFIERFSRTVNGKSEEFITAFYK